MAMATKQPEPEYVWLVWGKFKLAKDDENPTVLWACKSEEKADEYLAGLQSGWVYRYELRG